MLVGINTDVLKTTGNTPIRHSHTDATQGRGGRNELRTSPRQSWPTQRFFTSRVYGRVYGSVDANQPFEISPISSMFPHETWDLSSVDGERLAEKKVNA